VRIETEPEACISAGNCVMVAGAVFDQDEDGIVVTHVDEVPEEELEHVREAVKLCPAAALRLVD
jgi:ferredoxin